MKHVIVVALAIFLLGSIVSFFTFQKSTEKLPYEEIVTEQRPNYIVKNILYTGTNIEFKNLEKVMRDIRKTCEKQCKINLYSTREAYEMESMAGESNFVGYTPEQQNYLSTHVLAFWGMGENDNIVYYPSKR